MFLAPRWESDFKIIPWGVWSLSYRWQNTCSTGTLPCLGNTHGALIRFSHLILGKSEPSFWMKTNLSHSDCERHWLLTDLVFAAADGWPRPGSCSCHPTASQHTEAGSEAFPKARFSTYMWNLVENKRLFLALPCSIQDFGQVCANIQHSQGCCGKQKQPGEAALCCWCPDSLAFILFSKRQ